MESFKNQSPEQCESGDLCTIVQYQLSKPFSKYIIESFRLLFVIGFIITVFSIKPVNELLLFNSSIDQITNQLYLPIYLLGIYLITTLDIKYPVARPFIMFNFVAFIILATGLLQFNQQYFTLFLTLFSLESILMLYLYKEKRGIKNILKVIMPILLNVMLFSLFIGIEDLVTVSIWSYLIIGVIISLIGFNKLLSNKL